MFFFSSRNSRRGGTGCGLDGWGEVHPYIREGTTVSRDHGSIGGEKICNGFLFVSESGTNVVQFFENTFRVLCPFGFNLTICSD